MNRFSTRNRPFPSTSSLARFAVMAAAFAAPHAASAQCFELQSPIRFSGENVAGDRVGDAVAIYGSTIVIGAPGDDNSGGADAGAAFVYVKSGETWALQQKLLASDRAATDRFGEAVAIFGDTLIVGADRDDNSNGANAGAAYIFQRSGTTWTEIAKLTAFDGAANDNFGASVAFASIPNRTYALVGSPRDGSVYVFSINPLTPGATWGGSTKFAPNDGPASFFGTTISAAGNTAIVGTLDSRAYVFTASTIGGWVQQQRINPPSGGSFGSGVGISGNTVVISGTGEDTIHSESAGAAYVFTRNSGVWSFQQRLIADDGQEFDSFGTHLAISGDTILASAFMDDDSGLDAGAAYLFTRTGNTWSQRRKFYGSPQAGEAFGNCVALQGGTALIGAPTYDAAGQADSGRAFIRDFVRTEITQHPVSISTCAFGSATFTAAAIVTSNTPGSQRWHYRAGSGALIALTDGPNLVDGRLLLNAAGATTTTLTVDRGSLGWTSATTHQFVFGVDSSGCQSTVFSAAASLTICLADFNCSGDVTVQDIFDFLTQYFAGNFAADVNGSTSVTVQDVFDFLQAYFNGCD